MNPMDGGFMSPDNGGTLDGLCLAGAPDSPLDNILCKLSSMLEDCLFHMVDWVNRTEIFRVIRVSVCIYVVLTKVLSIMFSSLVLSMHTCLRVNVKAMKRGRESGIGMTINRTLGEALHTMRAFSCTRFTTWVHFQEGQKYIPS